MTTLTIRTASRTDLRDVTREVAAAVAETKIDKGVCVVTVPHTTAGITINENADPDVRQDLMDALERLVPWEAAYAHSEGNAAAHVKTALVGNSAMVPVEKGQLVLGTWQGIYLCEFDGPRPRKVVVQVLPEAGE